MSLLDQFPHRATIRRRIRQKTGDLGGSKDYPTVEQTDVECWEQQLSASEQMEFQKRGINIRRKIYFLTDPQVTERHDILITSRMDENGDLQTVDNPQSSDVLSEAEPDASAGLGMVYRVYTGQSTARLQ